ncbi:hypothetical protein KIW84_040209 [Lathyrus oleraceus]|uniref:Uncharacterized protein n=1 Tax=Pisum sativum TaxID=3888 RepID=A0A9D4X5J2_PEA|nr:hypothetical protein KIW84_040209 [Pisum sativum]
MLHKEPPSIIHLKVVMPLPSLLKEPNLIQGLQKLCSLVSKMELRVYILYDLNSYNVFVSRNVIFYETHFALKPYTSTSITASDPPQPQPPLDLGIEPTIPPTNPPLDYPPESPKSLSPFSATIDMTPTPLSPTHDHHNDINIMQPTSISSSSSPPPSLPIRKSIHVTKPPSYLEDFHSPSSRVLGLFILIRDKHKRESVLVGPIMDLATPPPLIMDFGMVEGEDKDRLLYLNLRS